MTKFALLLAAAVPLLAAAPVLAQAPAPVRAQVQTNPAPGCTATPAQLEANRKVVIAFFRRGVTQVERLAMVDPSYIQHNPRFVKFAAEHHMSDYDAFKAVMGGGGVTGVGAGPGGGGGGLPAPPPGSPTPPQGDLLNIVTAECDLVTVVHKNFRQDPTAAPGTWFELYGFDTFRVKNGKLTEHWDGAAIEAPPAAR
ncbi:MAG TPA: hypothetical protein VL358_07615 [Caulobacteraceae bacterium]|jgi:predicted SnoaL-like aldol condensation-catalyzing enzyme|nr:hypothetical protein [Caulobacteraceae bacterium]